MTYTPEQIKRHNEYQRRQDRDIDEMLLDVDATRPKWHPIVYGGKRAKNAV